MCAVCALYDYGRQMNPDFWTSESLELFRKLLGEAKTFDEDTGQPDCEDPKKSEWLEIVERQVEGKPLESTFWCNCGIEPPHTTENHLKLILV